MNKDIYIVAYYALTPKNPKHTGRKGYMNNVDNLEYTESINITRGLKPRDITAGVILNLNKKTVVRNTFNDNRDFPSLLAHYQESYPQYINPVISMLYKDELNETTGNVRTQEENQTS